MRSKAADGNRKNIGRYIVPAAVFGFFLFTMRYQLMHSGLWGDEWVEYTVSLRSIEDGSLVEAVKQTYQPPLYNILMHYWLTVDDSLLWFRSFNIVVGTVTGIFLFLTVLKTSGVRAALCALTALACCYRWVYCIQECSEYALMLAFLSGALFFYVCAYEKCRLIPFFCMVLFCIAALYTQYGAAFAAVPLLAVFFLSIVVRQNVSFWRKAIVAITYSSAAVFSAIPLMAGYLYPQMENNGLLEQLYPDWWEAAMELPVALGRMLGYFFAADKVDNLYYLYIVLGIILLAALVLMAASGKEEQLNRSLAAVLLIGYVIHMAAVKSRLYGVTSPGNVKGYLSRYSYFYIPMLTVTVPAAISFIFKNIRKDVRGTAGLFASMIGGCLLFISLYYLSFNWEKALDDRFADLWYERGGMQEVTFLTGRPVTGAEYYIMHHEEYEEGVMDNVTAEFSTWVLPEGSFYVWNTNWGGERMERLLTIAVQRGFATEYLLTGGEQNDCLIYCTKTPRIDIDPKKMVKAHPDEIDIDPVGIAPAAGMSEN